MKVRKLGIREVGSITVKVWRVVVKIMWNFRDK